MDIRLILLYSDNCRRRLRETLAGYPEAFDTPFETTSEYKSVRALVAHCIGAEQRWTEQRIHGQSGSVRYEDCAAETLTGLFSDWERIRTLTRAVIEGDHDTSRAPQLHHQVAFTLPQSGYSDTLTVEECLFQVFNHQTFHLGQVLMALQRMGVDPPNFDYVLLHHDTDE